MDLTTTFALAGGANASSMIDGENLLPVLRAETDSLHQELSWHFPHYHRGSQMQPGAAMRAGNWKLVTWFGRQENGQPYPPELYNLATDPGEQLNLARSQLLKLRQLLQKQRQWQEQTGAQLPQPL